MITELFFHTMPTAPSAEVTVLLKAWRDGDDAALDQLIPVVYEELRRLARRQRRADARSDTLQTTALVNEAYLRLVDARHVDWAGRAHFFAISAQIMRRIVIDAARSRASRKRGGEFQRADLDKIDLDQLPSSPSGRDRLLVAIDSALDALAAVDARKARVIELRFFGGLTVEETAGVLKISNQSVLRDWKLAKAWLQREIRGSLGD
jgi:RNA polymerase sigma-70 factor, ECF subfamily